jgi:hypothetical protein
MSGKRRAIILAAAGALTVTTAVAATAATSPSAAHAASSASQIAKSTKADATVDAMTSGVAATDLNLEKARATAIAAAQQKVAQQRAAQRAHVIYLNRQAKEKAATTERAHAIYLNRQAQQKAAQQAAAEQAAQQKAATQSQTQSTSTSSTSSTSSSGSSGSSSSTSYSGSPQTIAQEMLSSYGWSGQFSCLDELWQKESNWSVTASNAGSGAYGIPQALPGSKMASAGADWQTDAATQIKWGLEYIQSTYGSPCAAWSHETADGWY